VPDAPGCKLLRYETTNLLDRDFTADAPNQKWAGDISYIWTGEGWLYLAVILDLYSRRIIGWAVSDRLKRDLAIRALNMAVALRRPPPGCIHHTDRGSQYCSHGYQNLLCKHGFLVSMSGKGNCYDTGPLVLAGAGSWHFRSGWERPGSGGEWPSA
jgi:transposase InsO family protein